MDVKTAFLNEYVEDDIYMEYPKGFVSEVISHKACKINRSIYRLKQASPQLESSF